MGRFIRKLLDYAGKRDAIVLLAWVSLLQFSLPFRTTRLFGMTCLAGGMAFAFWQERNKASRVFLRTRPGWVEFVRETWLGSFVIAALFCGGLLLVRSLDLDVALITSLTGDDWGENLRAEAEASVHPNLFAYLVVLHVGTRLLLSDRGHWGLALVLLSVFIASVPDVRDSGTSELYLWPSLELWEKTLAVSAIGLVASFPLWRTVLPRGGRDLHHNRVIRRLLSAELVERARLHMAACLGFLFWILMVRASFPRDTRPILAPLGFWGIFQFLAALHAARSQAYYLTRPRGRGSGAIGGMRSVFNQAYRRTVLVALLVSLGFTWWQAVPGLSVPLILARAAFMGASASAAFLAMLLTWWLISRERETPFLAAVTYVLALYAPSLYANAIGAPNPYLWLWILLLVNGVLFLIWLSLTRLPLQVGVNAVRILWLPLSIVLAAGFLWCIDQEFCIRGVDVLLYALRSGGYALSVWLALIGTGTLLTFAEGKAARRLLPAELVGLGLSLVIPFLGLVFLHVTRSRVSWHFREWRLGLSPKLVLPWVLGFGMAACAGVSWWQDVISEAYLQSPLRGLSRRFLPVKEPIASIAVYPLPERLTLDGVEIPNPWRMSRRQARARLAAFFVKSEIDRRPNFDTHALAHALQMIQPDKSRVHYHIRVWMPSGVGWMGTGHETSLPPGEWSLGETEDASREIQIILASETDDAGAVSGIFRRFGKNTVFDFDKYLSSGRWLSPPSDSIAPGDTARISRARILAVIEQIAKEEGQLIPSIEEIRTCGRLVRPDDRCCADGPERSLVEWNAIFKIGQKPQPFLSNLVTELEGAYVAGGHPPAEVERMLGWALYSIWVFGLDIAPPQRERFVAAVWGNKHPRSDSGFFHSPFYLAGASPMQKEYAASVVRDWDLMEKKGVLPILAETGHERLRPFIIERLRWIGTRYDPWDTSQSVLVWPDRSILDTVDSTWQDILQQSQQAVRYLDTVPALIQMVDGLAEKWPDDPRVKKWSGEAHALYEK